MYKNSTAERNSGPWEKKHCCHKLLYLVFALLSLFIENNWTGHGDVMLHSAATYVFSYPLPTYHKQQPLLPYGNSEGTRYLIVLSGGEPFKSQCYEGQGLVVPVQLASSIGPTLKGTVWNLKKCFILAMFWHSSDWTLKLKLNAGYKWQYFRLKLLYFIYDRPSLVPCCAVKPRRACSPQLSLGYR